jgi:hypothetical protein
VTDGAIDLRDGAGPPQVASRPAGADDPAWLLRAVKERIEALPGVVKVGGGGLGEVATYLPGDRVAGMRVVEGTLQVSIVAAVGIPLVELAADVRRTANWPGRVDVHVADVHVPEPPPAPSTTTLPGSAAGVARADEGRPSTVGGAPSTPLAAPPSVRPGGEPTGPGAVTHPTSMEGTADV